MMPKKRGEELDRLQRAEAPRRLLQRIARRRQQPDSGAMVLLRERQQLGDTRLRTRIGADRDVHDPLPVVLKACSLARR